MLFAEPWPVLPSWDQCQLIGHLRRLTGRDVILDVTPVAEPATQACARGWTHGPGLVRLTTGEVLCLKCAATVIKPMEWQSKAGVAVEVLRESEAHWRWQWWLSDAAEAAL